MLYRKRKINDFHARFCLGKKLGTGGFSIVYQAHSLLTDSRNYAVKVMELNGDEMGMRSRLRIESNIENELKIIKCLNGHPNIIFFYDAFVFPDKIYLLMEYLGGGVKDAYERIIERKILCSVEDERYIRRIFVQVAEGLQYMHSKCIMHRDIKPENVLITENEHWDGNFQPITVKTVDFGLSKQLPHSNARTTTVFGSPNYMAPEIQVLRVLKSRFGDVKKKLQISNSSIEIGNTSIARKLAYGKSADVWSLGAFLFVFLYGTFPCHKLQEDANDAIQEYIDSFSYPECLNDIVDTSTDSQGHATPILSCMPEQEGTEIEGKEKESGGENEKEEEEELLEEDIISFCDRFVMREVVIPLSMPTSYGKSMISTKAIELIKAMMAFNVADRILLEDVLTSDWIQELSLVDKGAINMKNRKRKKENKEEEKICFSFSDETTYDGDQVDKITKRQSITDNDDTTHCKDAWAELHVIEDDDTPENSKN